MECSLAVLLGYMDIQSLQMLYKTSRRFLFTGESSVWGRALGHAALEIDKVILEGMGSLRLRMDFLQRRLHLLGPQSIVEPPPRSVRLAADFSGSYLSTTACSRGCEQGSSSHRRGDMQAAAATSAVFEFDSDYKPVAIVASEDIL